jgi:2-polyprenyl-3-methyl-5-hydroxy-6-metoxy-1,4-benzoquinol methylase
MKRRIEAERMDAPDTTWPEFASALRDLAFLNRIGRSYPPVTSFLDRVVRETGATRLTVLDVGAGGGDTIERMHRWAAKRGVTIAVTGLDRSPWAGRYAADAGVNAEWLTLDLFALDPERRFDVVVCSLFAHHLEEEATLIRFLRWIDVHATRAWLISDLHRSWIPWASVWAGTRLLRLDPMVCHDGPISFAKALDRGEWQRAIAASGVAAELHWGFPFRWLVSRVRAA